MPQIILSLDNFNKSQSAREYEEHRHLVSQAIDILSCSASVSSIAARGTRLLSELLAEEHKFNSQSADGGLQAQINGRQRPSDITNEKSLNVAAFVKKFCESDLPPPGNSPIATSLVPLWLQDCSTQPQSGHSRIGDGQYSQQNYSNPIPAPYETMNTSYDGIPPIVRRYDNFGSPFGDPFNIRSLNWFDDLLGLAPSNSI
ncbi:hypothetical protein B0O99DRAFT_53219 [Bisporella sp. PMI_857]|jgi:hypothetical protein|nr:hypothetical protein B0O99DRAFT_53219 [Bisporella sp. PMI_857]